MDEDFFIINNIPLCFTNMLTLSRKSLIERRFNVSCIRRSRLCTKLDREQRYVRFNEKKRGGSRVNKEDMFPIHTPKSPCFVPSGYLAALQKSGQLDLSAHMRWMMQKDALGQDMFLVGAPGPLRRRLALSFCELSGREVELLTLSQDTTEADLKQRREIVDSTAIYVDQAPLRAALQGRVLVLDGMEKAERNVLPTLNNLLENREMSLSDGRFLLSAARYDSLLKSGETEESLRASGLLRVSEHFRVIALGLPVPEFPGYPLDPPLRSRFQGRYIRPVSNETQITSRMMGNTACGFSSTTDSNVEVKISQVASFFHAIRLIKAKHMGRETGNSDVLSSPKVLPIPQTALLDASVLLQEHPSLTVHDIIQSIYPYQLFGLDNVQITAMDGLVAGCSKAAAAESLDITDSVSTFSKLVGHQKRTLLSISRTHGMNQDICLVGNKGEGLIIFFCNVYFTRN